MNKMNFSWINPNDIIKRTGRVNSSRRKLFRQRIIKTLEDNSVSKEKNKPIRLANTSVISKDNINNKNNLKKLNYLKVKRKTKKIIKDDKFNRKDEKNPKIIRIN